MNSYRDFVAGFAELFQEGKLLSPRSTPQQRKPKPDPNAPIALMFSPHPDDESIIGGLALRLLREANVRIVNVAVTLGSDEKRRSARLRELKRACDFLGFELEQPAQNGLEQITPAARNENLRSWKKSVETIAAILFKYQPCAIFFPHKADHHPTHIGTHWLVMDALKSMPKDFCCHLIETEFWGQMTSSNLLVESTADDMADLVTALSFHVGEVRRNPYHLRLPAWMQDNVRRGAELIAGQGAAAPSFVFGTIYRLRQWKNRHVTEVSPPSKLIAANEFPGAIIKRVED